MHMPEQLYRTKLRHSFRSVLVLGRLVPDLGREAAVFRHWRNIKNEGYWESFKRARRHGHRPTANSARESVQGACEIPGLDPLYVANEGKLLAIVGHEDAASVLRRMR